MASRIENTSYEDIEVLLVKKYRQPENRRDLLNSVEAVPYTSQYGIGIDQNFSRDGAYDAYMVHWKYKGSRLTRFMRFTKSGTPIDRK